ncbi:hypothetical protein JHK87_000369 [Glycine soja]|nr:hypothetical protein JHK87_000369 [Glycine soja]
MVIIGSPHPGGSSKELLWSPEEADAREFHNSRGTDLFSANSYLEISGEASCSDFKLGIKIERQSKQKLIEFARELRSFPSIDMSEMEGLLEALHHMTALKELRSENLPKLQSLPDCLGNLLLLQSLKLLHLPQLESLPDCFENLPLLRIWVESRM